MKQIILFTTLVLAFGCNQSNKISDNKNLVERTFKVSGNCGMCERRIEKASESQEGVVSAEWNKKTKITKVTFDSTKTNVHNIQLAIAGVGHNTELYRATNEIYNGLPGCCQYTRD